MARVRVRFRVRLQADAAWQLMARRNLSQNELANLLGVTSGYISLMFNGQRCPSPRLRRRFLEVLPDARFEDLFAIER